MTGMNRIWTVALIAALGAWGCAKGPANHYATQAEKIKSLENKCAKLEDDYKAVAGARDQARRRVTALEEETAHQQKELADLRLVLKERDALKTQLEGRTGERDLLQARCDKLKKGIQSLLGQDDALLSPTPAGTAPLTSSTAAPVLGPS